MPEYSGTTITPADGVQVPAMNGASGGNFLLSALRNYILASKAQANGLASLDGNGKLPAAQLPDLADDVIVVASYATLPAQGESGKIYITADNNKMYRWDSNVSDYVVLSVDLSAYATKAELNAEIATREAIDQNLDTRLTNVETALTGTVIQEHVDSTQKNVKTILSADTLLPWAIMKRVGARSTQFNQLCENGNFDGTANWNYDGASFTQSGNKGIVVGDSNYANLYKTSFPLIANHTYLAFGTAKASASITIKLYFGTSSRVNFDSKTVTANTTTFFAGVGTYTTQDNVLQFGCESGAGGATVEFSNVMVFDLTAMNEATLTAAQFKAKYPASYYAQNAGSLIDLPPSSFLCRGTNQWDEEWELTTLAGNSCVASKNFIRVIPSTTYFLYVGNNYVSDYGIVVVEYDADGNVLKQDRTYSTTLTVSANTAYIKIGMISGYYGTTYKNDVMVCLNSVTDKTYKPANHRTIDTSFMAGTKYVNPNCYDYAENVYVNGILKRKMQTVVGVVDLGNLEWLYTGSYWVTGAINTLIKKPSADNIPANIIAEKYATSNWSAGGNMTIAISASGSIGVEYADGVNPPTGIMYYELATLPDPTYGDPIPNFPCEDGTTITAITPQTDIVNAIDVPSTIVYGTKISA